jgi:uncharacterized protein (DUF2235 family)
MPKNVIIFSDGTGQVGGINFDEDRTNIYKMYRACRVCPDSSIDPAEQVAFYDPGLGSVADGGHLIGRMTRWVYNKISQATGLGITANIVDCYAALIRLWRPGDKIYLFGFSRGAYTVRCLASVIGMCGIPQRDDDKKIHLDVSSSRKIAKRAVKSVYQFTHSVRRDEAGDRDKRLMDQRTVLARQFRDRYRSGDPADAAKANVYPHFIGVFDTVSAIATPTSLAVLCTACVAVAAVLAGAVWTGAWAWDAPVIHWIAGFSYVSILAVIIAAMGAVALGLLALASVKWTGAIPGVPWWRTVHLAQLKQQFMDFDLNPNAGYARHAISIDENRASFARVPWGFNDPKHDELDASGNPWFQQLWFAGNHADIGGGYPENESRLSDWSLAWMVDEARKVGLKVDDRVLTVHPSSDGMQHDEVKSGLGAVTQLTGGRATWKRGERRIPGPETTLHPSVVERFACVEVLEYDVYQPYRPRTLRGHVGLGGYYGSPDRQAPGAFGYVDVSKPTPTKEEPTNAGVIG